MDQALPSQEPCWNIGLGIHQLFELSVDRQPDAIAAVYDAELLSYQDLDRQANQLAHHLRALNVRPGDRVGICLPRSSKLLVALLAVLKAGAAYLPLDPAYPQERLQFMIQDAAVETLLTERHLAQSPAIQAQRIVYLDTGWQAIAAQPLDRLESILSAELIAYIIYTSGSTGQPKGVLVPHRAIVNHSRTIGEHYRLTPNDRVLQFAALSFDVAAEEIFATWSSGGTVVLRPETVSSSFVELHQLIDQAQITILNLPAAYWHEWIVALEQDHMGVPPSVRCVIVGSDQVLIERFERWQSIAPQVRLLNAYGPTETTITATVFDPARDQWPDSGTVMPIGRPITNLSVQILDSQLQPVAVGKAGELYIGGAGVARGYLNRPALTAERFIPDPWGSTPGARMYRTGDCARQLQDGTLEFLGRIDQQVKLRGFRIELGEIEAALRSIPAIRDAIVVLREDTPGQPMLAAYLILEAAQTLTAAEARAALESQLPAYMLPTLFMVLHAFPLTPNGKLDRKGLPIPANARLLDPGRTYVEPENELEQSIAAIWQETLGLERVGVTINFFDLGGTSLLLQRVQRLCEQRLERKIPITALFEHSTVRALARHLSDDQDQLAVLRSRIQQRLRSRARQPSGRR